MQPFLKPLIGAAVGAAVGYAMHRYVGCRTGACPLTANAYTSTLIYALMGALLVGGR